MVVSTRKKKTKKEKLKEKNIMLIALACVFILVIIVGSILLNKIITSDNDDRESDIVDDLPSHFRVQEGSLSNSVGKQ